MIDVICINRNIVECKALLMIVCPLSNRNKRCCCINRNIVECKVQRITVKTCIVSVLIETLWNVMNYVIIIISNKGGCINRNIVECKDFCAKQFFKPAHVLIETLWNVKLIKGIIEPVIGEQY